MTKKIIGTVSCCVECEYCKPNDNGGLSCDFVDIPIFDACGIAEFCPLPNYREERYDKVSVPKWFMDFCTITRGISKYSAQKAYSRILRIKRTGIGDKELLEYPIDVVMDLFDPSGRYAKSERDSYRYAIRLFRGAGRHQRMDATGFDEFIEYCVNVRHISPGQAEQQFRAIVNVRIAGFENDYLVSADERDVVDEFLTKTKRNLNNNVRHKYRSAIRNYVSFIQNTGGSIDAQIGN